MCENRSEFGLARSNFSRVQRSVFGRSAERENDCQDLLPAINIILVPVRRLQATCDTASNRLVVKAELPGDRRDRYPFADEDRESLRRSAGQPVSRDRVIGSTSRVSALRPLIPNGIDFAASRCLWLILAE
jgi:hypothetical protein